MERRQLCWQRRARRDGKPFHHVHFFITTLRTSPKALLRLVRQGNGVQVLALLRTLALNLLGCNGFRSIRAGLMVVAHDIRRMLGWVGILATEKG